MRFGLLVLLLAAVTRVIAAQNAAPPVSAGPQFSIRAESRLVLVDAVVTDKKGKPVRDLSAGDFRVWEDNKEQAISGFGLETAALSPERAQKRYLIFLFDNSTLSPSLELSARQEVVKFIDAYAAPDRYLAIVNFNRTSLVVAQNFTAMADRLKRAAAAVQGTGSQVAVSSVQMTGGTSRGASRQNAMVSSADTYTSRALLSSLRTLVESLAAVRGRKALILLSGGFSLLPELVQPLQDAIDACNRANVAVYAIDARGLGSSFSSSTSGVPVSSNLLPAGLPGAIGRLVSGFVPSYSWTGFASTLLQTSGQAGGQGGSGGQTGGGGATPGGGGGGAGTPGGSGGSAGRGGTTGGPTAGGSRTGPGMTSPGASENFPSPGERQYDDQEPLRALASGTGGLFIKNTSQIMEALGQIAQEQDEYYILGYVPPQVPERSCHALRVRVNRRGLTVRARNSYCSDKPVELLAGTSAAKDLEARAAASSAGNITASLQLPYFYPAPNVARVHLAMEILPTGMKVQKQGGKFHSEMNVLGIAHNSGGEVAARFSDVVKLDFQSQKEADAFLSQPFRYEKQFETAPGNYKFTIALSSGAESFGKLEAPLIIEPYDSRTLAVSGLALGREVRAAADLTSGLDESLLTGQKTLVADGVQLTPSGANRFKRTERCLVYVEVYEPLLAAANPPTVGVRFRVIDHKTGEQKVDSGMFSVSDRVRTGKPVVPLILAAPLADLAPGPYQIEVRAADSAGGNSTVRTADFEVD